jgi:hypothetical protein
MRSPDSPFRRTLAAAVLLACTTACAAEVNLKIKKLPDPTGKYPNSMLYLAFLVNEGDAEIPATAKMMPGGYVGSGTFFNCAVEEWDAARKQWRPITTTDPSGFGTARTGQVLIRRKEDREVCRQMLPQQADRAGACVRFRFSQSWEGTGRSWVSRPFAVDRKATLTPCR